MKTITTYTYTKTITVAAFMTLLTLLSIVTGTDWLISTLYFITTVVFSVGVVAVSYFLINFDEVYDRLETKAVFDDKKTVCHWGVNLVWFIIMSFGGWVLPAILVLTGTVLGGVVRQKMISRGSVKR